MEIHSLVGLLGESPPAIKRKQLAQRVDFLSLLEIMVTGTTFTMMFLEQHRPNGVR